MAEVDLEAARSYLGAPYEWGGMTDRGIDCSGLVHMAYRRTGRLVPRDADQQEAAATAIDESAARPGDLVCFDGLGHVGIYIGGAQFIHAPHTGDVVKVSSLSESWYAATYVGARRIL